MFQKSRYEFCSENTFHFKESQADKNLFLKELILDLFSVGFARAGR